VGEDHCHLSHHHVSHDTYISVTLSLSFFFKKKKDHCDHVGLEGLLDVRLLVVLLCYLYDRERIDHHELAHAVDLCGKLQ